MSSTFPSFGDPRYRAPAATVAQLPVTGTLNEIRLVAENNSFYTWDGSAWQAVKAVPLTSVFVNILQDVACDASVYVGAVVRVVSEIMQLAQADNLANSHVIGICESKASTTVCNVRLAGASTSIFSGLDESKTYFLSDTIAGALQTTPPTSPGSVVLSLGQPLSSTKLIVQIGQKMVRS